MRKLCEDETDHLIRMSENLNNALYYLVNSEEDESLEVLENLKYNLEELVRRLNQGTHTYIVNVDGRAWY